MNKYLVLTDNTKIPIDDISNHGMAICYPESMTQVEEWWGKLSADTIAKHIYMDSEGNESIIFEDNTLHFNKIELENCSTGLLMRIMFASRLQDEITRLMEENNNLRDKANAYDVLVEGTVTE